MMFEESAFLRVSTDSHYTMDYYFLYPYPPAAKKQSVQNSRAHGYSTAGGPENMRLSSLVGFRLEFQKEAVSGLVEAE